MVPGLMICKIQNLTRYYISLQTYLPGTQLSALFSPLHSLTSERNTKDFKEHSPIIYIQQLFHYALCSVHYAQYLIRWLEKGLNIATQ